MFISSYLTKKGTNTNHASGLVLIWDAETGGTSKIDGKSRPTRVLEFTNTVTSLAFVKNNPHIVVGGTNTGRILVWDVRSNRKTPSNMSEASPSILGNVCRFNPVRRGNH
ncbi:Cytoplasmic dynein 1 intermediate chain 1 [Thelohanellus kitauei]|uniref:Cytoplasmic dynein 1 intermediate chain 1 n=1 Tax=Thelohanellus kitauei TaxID=669202 RepID=A0A0C2NAS0_THEKT|nr:Cytoplasmic dynein 1 intermediate chain 1 [Thelohanellus kitauei]